MSIFKKLFIPKEYLILALIMLAGMLAGCAPSIIGQREQAWREHNITAYRIEVLVIRSIWHAQSYQITVRGGQVESSTAVCIPAPMEAGKCKVEEFNADDYTVAGLFRKAQAETQSEYAAWVTITYDPNYGFPQQIAYNNPKVIDGDWSWRVTAFEVLK